MKKILIFLVGLFLLPLSVHAASLKDTYGFDCDGTAFLGCTLKGQAPGAVAIALSIMVSDAIRVTILTVAFIATVYGGYRIIAARGNSEGVEAGKKAIMWAVVGYFFATVAYPIARFVIDFIVTVGG